MIALDSKRSMAAVVYIYLVAACVIISERTKVVWSKQTPSIFPCYIISIGREASLTAQQKRYSCSVKLAMIALVDRR